MWALSTLTGLEQLEIKGSVFEKDLAGLPFLGLDRLSRLRQLQLPHHAPTTCGMARVGRLSSLTALTLLVGELAAPYLPAALARPTGLCDLELDSRTPLSLGPPCLGHLSSMTSLALHGPNHVLRGLARMPSLRHLSLA